MPGPRPLGSETPSWLLLGDIIDKREIGVRNPALWFNLVHRNLRKWAMRIRLWIRRAVNRVSMRAPTPQHSKSSEDAFGKRDALRWGLRNPPSEGSTWQRRYAYERWLDRLEDTPITRIW
jgi:hypothetical protein